MHNLTAMKIQPHEWNQLLAGLPHAHILQTWEWGRVKARYGWDLLPLVWVRQGGQLRFIDLRREPLPAATPMAAALVLQRTLSLGGVSTGLRILYAPKGPLLIDWEHTDLRQRVLDDLQLLAREQRAIFIKIDPDVRLGVGIPDSPEAQAVTGGIALRSDLETRGWLFSRDQIQFRNAVMLDLSASEDDLLARMKQKTRYNIRLAGRKGVSVRVATPSDFPLLYRIYAETSVRDGFVIRDEAYYRFVWELFTSSGLAEPLIASVAGEPVAGLFVFRFAGTAWYLYGMSREVHRNKMPNYLLQWEAIRRAKAANCLWYDLWGAPEVFNPQDPLWGVFRFKEGLGGQVVRHIGAWDYPARPALYSLYTRLLPRVLAVIRKRGRSRTRQSLDS